MYRSWLASSAYALVGNTGRALEGVKEAGKLGLYIGTYKCPQLGTTSTLTVYELDRLRMKSSGGMAGDFLLKSEGNHKFRTTNISPEGTVAFKVSDGVVKSFELNIGSQGPYKFVPE